MGISAKGAERSVSDFDMRTIAVKLHKAPGEKKTVREAEKAGRTNNRIPTTT